MNKIDLTTLATKFGSIPSSLTQRAQIVPEYLTEEEFALLPQCPRQGTVETLGRWPTIGGRRTYPLSGALNAEEKARYNELKKASKDGTASGSPRTVSPRQKALTEDQKAFNQKLEDLKALLSKEKASKEALAMVDALMIEDPADPVVALLGTKVIPEAVSPYALMFRKADGSRLPLDISAVDFAMEAAKGLIPVYNETGLKAKLAELEAQGIIIKLA